MDLLQEISNKLRSESGRVWSKLSDLAYDATIGIAKEYRKKALELVKITAAAYYIQALSILRKHFLLLFLLVFTVVLLAVTAVVVPVAMVLAAPWTSTVKLVCLAVLGVVYSASILAGLSHLFSEEKWMKASGFQELLESIHTDNQ